MKTQRRVVDGEWPRSGIAETGSRIAEHCVAFVTVFLSLALALVNGTASRIERVFSWMGLPSRQASSGFAGYATKSLLQTGYRQQLCLLADGVRRPRSAPGRDSGWRQRAASVDHPHRMSFRVCADRQPENSPPPVRVPSGSCLQPVVPAVRPGTERHHGQRDLYFKHAA